MTLARRVAALEQTTAPAVLEVVLRGGIPDLADDGEPRLARAGEHAWHRLPDETFAAFRHRLRTEATGAGVIVFDAAGLG